MWRNWDQPFLPILSGCLKTEISSETQTFIVPKKSFYLVGTYEHTIEKNFKLLHK